MFNQPTKLGGRGQWGKVKMRSTGIARAKQIKQSQSHKPPVCKTHIHFPALQVHTHCHTGK